MGDRPVKDHELTKLSDVLEVPSDYLLGLSENPETKTEHSKGYDSLAEIQAIVDDLGIDNIGFFDIEKWKKLSAEDVEDIKKHFEWITHKARERKIEGN